MGSGPPKIKENFLLTNRKQYLVFSVKSKVLNVPSGLPQGGHLLPLLFVLFVNMVTNVFRHTQFLLFAYDLKLFMKIKLENDCRLLQSDINALVAWANNLELYVTKCRSMLFLRKRVHLVFIYTLCGVPLPIVNNLVKDLLVTLIREINFNAHIEASCCKALKKLGFSKWICNKDKFMVPIKALYCALVRSILEHANVIWDSYAVSNRNQIERV